MSEKNTKQAEKAKEEKEIKEKETEEPLEQELNDESRDEKDEIIKELETELKEKKDSLLRKAAEVENIRKRVQRERAHLFESAKINAIEKFLPVNDDLQRTVEAVDKSKIDDEFKEGVLMVAEKFEQTLNELGVERINETGVPFNVDLHDAMFRQKPENDSIDSDIVLHIVENGYKLGDRTIRHAKVIVSE